MKTGDRVGGLLRHRDFRHLWAADAISQFGTRISYLAVPLLAISTLQASSFEVSLLRAFQTIAYLLIGLQVGAWCDRMRCRPVLVSVDLGRALALGSVPVAAAFHILTFGQLFAVVFVTGVLTVFFDVAHQTYLPRLIGRDQLVEGNARLQGNASVAAVAAPTIAGYLVQWFTAPFAVLADAASYLWSAVWLRSIRAREQPSPRVEGSTMRLEIAEGLRLVAGHPLLRAIAGNGMTQSLAQSAHTAIIVVFLVRTVHLSPAQIGLLTSVGLAGAIVAALSTRRLIGVVGHSRLMWVISLVNGVGFLLFPLTSAGGRLSFYAAAGFVTSFCIIALAVVQVSFQQSVCPERLLGRMNATMKFLIWGAMPPGSVLGGLLATFVGLRTTLWVAAAGVLLAAAWLLFSPLRSMRHLPDPIEP